MASISASGVQSTNPDVKTDTTITSPDVDNETYSYWVEMSVSPDGGLIYPIGAYVTLE